MMVYSTGPFIKFTHFGAAEASSHIALGIQPPKVPVYHVWIHSKNCPMGPRIPLILVGFVVWTLTSYLVCNRHELGSRLKGW